MFYLRLFLEVVCEVLGLDTPIGLGRAEESLRLRLHSGLRQCGVPLCGGLDAGLKPRSTSEATAKATATTEAHAKAKATRRYLDFGCAVFAEDDMWRSVSVRHRGASLEMRGFFPFGFSQGQNDDLKAKTTQRATTSLSTSLGVRVTT